MRISHSAAALVEEGHIIAARRKSGLPTKSRTRATLRMPFANVSTRAPCPSTSLIRSFSARGRLRSSNGCSRPIDRQYLARPYYGSHRMAAWLATQATW
jgi:hypothetical protein